MNKQLFKSFMVMNGDTQAMLADVLHLPQSAISSRINGKTAFRQDEINTIRARWNLSDKQTVDIFFTTEVSKEDTKKGA